MTAGVDHSGCDARTVFRRHGIRMTAPRAAVYRVLHDRAEAMTAQTILDALEAEPAAQHGGEIWLSTIYRVLDCFVAAGLVAPDLLPGVEGMSYRLLHDAHHHFAVCLGCHRLSHLEHCPLPKTLPELERSGFAVTAHKVELYGYCRDCRSAGKDRQEQGGNGAPSAR